MGLNTPGSAVEHGKADVGRIARSDLRGATTTQKDQSTYRSAWRTTVGRSDLRQATITEKDRQQKDGLVLRGVAH